MSRTNESQRFLRTAEQLDREERDSASRTPHEQAARLMQLSRALPAVPPRRQLIHRSVLAIGMAVLPLILWGVGFAAFPILLLYWGEGWCIATANLYRILFSAAPGEGRRAPVALRYVLLFGVLWTAAGALFWLLYAPDAAIRALLTGRHWRDLAGYVLAQRLGWPLALTTAGLVIQAAQATAYIDAYLVFGAKTVARYGYGRVFAAFSLLALTPVFLLAASRLPVALSAGSEEQRAGLVLVLFVAALRLVLHLCDLWLPVWGRGLFHFGAALAASAEASAGTSRGGPAVPEHVGPPPTGLPSQDDERP